ncbi:acyl-CoA/acyl-ACP dehydrogenase [Phenylobacterium sp. LjRoot225]|uniref:acyl-CoA dehydrogenase family protein n=1 Tax=Phenylobacterium sp. LjRoot225 TaxID=3342285 RepID=UPI003ECFCB9D
MNVATSHAAQTGPSAASIGLAETPQTEDILVRARRVAAVAEQYAIEVDRDGRVPMEAIAQIKAERLFGVLAPRALGGEDASHAQIVEVCYILGQACASTAMIYAMHQVKAACIVRHGHGAAWHEGFLERLTEEQLLLASSTTEGKSGGAVRSSDAAIVHSGGRIQLERQAGVISYGEAADGLVTTARRAPDAASNDQVLLVLDRRDYSLTRTGGWDTLGMRGTVSAGFALRADAEAAQILPHPYSRIHAESMVPSAHLFWSATWAGIATGAVERARRFIRKAIRTEGKPPPAVAHLEKAMAALRGARALIATTTSHFESIKHDPAALTSLDFQSAITLLKVDASELAVQAVTHALRACGLSGYRNDGDASLSRHMRDVLSAPIMINNDRILADLATTSLVVELPQTICN